VYGLVDFLRHLPSGTVFFVLIPASVLVAALVIWRVAELYGDEVITLGEFLLVVALLLTVMTYLITNWRDMTPYIVAACYLAAFLVYVHLREGRERTLKIDYKRMQASLEEVRKARDQESRKRPAPAAQTRTRASAEEAEEAEERIAVCPFCQRESLIVRGKCMGCGQMVSKARDLLD